MLRFRTSEKPQTHKKSMQKKKTHTKGHVTRKTKSGDKSQNDFPNKNTRHYQKHR